MSFLRYGEIYHFDEGAIPLDRALAHRNDEFPAGYSLAGCAPAEPASASPAGSHFASKRLRSTIQFQRTANSVLTVCLTPGDNPISFRASSWSVVNASRCVSFSADRNSDSSASSCSLRTVDLSQLCTS